jgi:DNA-binding GntR family transcriptional regulator
VHHPLFSDDGLGVNALRIWLLLDPDDTTEVKALASITRLHRTTVKRALDKLFSAGLALAQEGGWVAIEATEHDLDEIATIQGVPQRQANRKAAHARERAIWQFGKEHGKRETWSVSDWLAYHKKFDLVGDARNAVVDDTLATLKSSQPKERTSA